MNKREKTLLFNLCKYLDSADELNDVELLSPEIIGHIFVNRMQGIAYGTLNERDLLGKIPKGLISPLKCGYDNAVERTRSYKQCVDYIAELLEINRMNAAFVKGAVLCNLYPEGFRTSNDIDLMVLPTNVSEVGRVLEQNGFRQGYMKNGVFVPATRKEIITSKMMRGETVPYFKDVHLPSMEYLEIDLNFSLDYKNNGQDTLMEMMGDVHMYEGVTLPSFGKYDFVLHLCCHLYKEASTLPWIKMKRDMLLYKYEDLYLILKGMNENDCIKLFERANKLGLEKMCAYSLMETVILFDISNITLRKLIENQLSRDKLFMDTVISPDEGKEFVFRTTDIKKRFFLKNRELDLVEKEVIN